MNNIRIVIVDEDSVYSKALSEYLQDEYGQAFDISCFSSTKALKEYFVSKHDTDVMLIEGSLFDESLKAFNVKTLLVLSENSMEHDLNGILAVYKYQSGDKIAKNILQHYDASTNKSFNIHKQSGESKVIVVYSPAGGSGKSTIAYNISRQYAQQTKKALLISIESYADLNVFKTNTKARGLSYLLYLLKNKTNNLQIKLDTIKEIEVNSNVHYIPRDYNCLEYKDTDGNDMAALLDFFKRQSGYDAVIFDLDSSVNERLLSIFKHCDAVLNVVGDDATAKDKQRNFINQIDIFNNLLGFNLADKIITINNKVASGANINAGESGNSYNSVDIPYIKDNIYVENGYYPEMVHFKLLYDTLEKFFISKRDRL